MVDPMYPIFEQDYKDWFQDREFLSYAYIFKDEKYRKESSKWLSFMLFITSSNFFLRQKV